MNSSSACLLTDRTAPIIVFIMLFLARWGRYEGSYSCERAGSLSLQKGV